MVLEVLGAVGFSLPPKIVLEREWTDRNKMLFNRQITDLLKDSD